MRLQAIDAGMRWLTAAGWLAVLVQWVRYQNLFVSPWFALYLAISLVHRLWQPMTVKQSLFIEPILLNLRFASVIEAVRLCFATSRTRERSWLTLLMLAVGALAVLALWLVGYHDLSSAAAAYASIRQSFHVALALACVMGAVCFAETGFRVDSLPRNHFLILTVHIAWLAALGFAKSATADAWLEVHIWYFVSVCVCLAMWLRLGPLFRL